MNVDTLKKPLLPFFPIEMTYSWRNVSKSTGSAESYIFQKHRKSKWKHDKGHFFPLFSIEMSYTGRNGSKSTGLAESQFFKNIGNQTSIHSKSIFSTFTNRDEVYWAKHFKKSYIKFYPVKTWKISMDTWKSRLSGLLSIEMRYTGRNVSKITRLIEFYSVKT